MNVDFRILWQAKFGCENLGPDISQILCVYCSTITDEALLKKA